MSVQIGMPVAVRDSNGNIYGGFISGFDGSSPPNPQVVWFDTTKSGPYFWQGPNTYGRDDTLSSNNRWAIVAISATVQFEGT